MGQNWVLAKCRRQIGCRKKVLSAKWVVGEMGVGETASAKCPGTVLNVHLMSKFYQIPFPPFKRNFSIL